MSVLENVLSVNTHSGRVTSSFPKNQFTWGWQKSGEILGNGMNSSDMVYPTSSIQSSSLIAEKVWRQDELFWVRRRLILGFQSITYGGLNCSLNTDRGTLQPTMSGNRRLFMNFWPLIHLLCHPVGFHLFWRRSQEGTETVGLGLYRNNRCR